MRVAPTAIIVSDEGPGLDPEDTKHAFERFYLWRKYRGDRPVGSGLGLAIVKHVVETAGGNVEARGAKGRGLDVRIHLPIA